MSRWGAFEHRVKTRIERAFAERTGGSLRIEELDLSLLPPTVRLANVACELPATDPAAPPLAAGARTIEARLAVRGLLALAAKRIHLAELRVERPTVSVRREFLEGRAGGTREQVPFDLRLDELEVVDGSVRYDDIEAPFSARARNVRLAGEWGAYRRAVVGRLAFEAALEARAFREALPVEIESGFRLTEARLELFAVRASGPGVDVTLRNHVVSWDSGVLLTANGQVEADLDRLEPWLSDAVPDVGGDVRGTIAWSRAGGPLEVRGRLRSDTARFGPIEAQDASIDARLEGTDLRLDVEQGVALGGSVRGQIDVALGGSPRVSMDLDGSSVALAEALAFLGLPLPFEGDADATFRFDGVVADRASWASTGRAVVRSARAPRAEGIAITGTGTFSLDRGILRVAASDLDTAAAELDLDVRYDFEERDGVVVISGTTEDASRTHAATLRVLDTLDVDTTGLLARPLGGVGDVEARVAVDAEGAAVDLELALSDGIWGSESFERAELDLGVREDRVRIDRAAIETATWSLEGTLDARLEDGEVDRVDARVDGAPLAALLAPFDMTVDEFDGRVTGAVSAERDATGLRGSGSLALDDATAFGESIGRAEGPFVVRADRLQLTPVTIDGPLGAGRGAVAIDLSTGDVEIEVEGADLELARIRRLTEAGSELAGTLGVSGAIARREGEVSGRLFLAGDDWTYAGRSLITVRGTADLSTDGVHVRASGKEDTSWTAEADVVWPGGPGAEGSDPTIDLRAEFDGFRFDLVDDPEAPPAWVKLRGALSVRGPLGDATRLASDGRFDLFEVRLGTRKLVASEAVAIRLEDERVEVGPIRMEGRHSDFTARLVADYGTRDLDLSIAGDVDLGAFTATMPDVASSGPVEVDVVARGTLDDPRISGFAAVERGRVRFVGLPQPIEDISCRIEIDGQSATIEGFRAIFGGGEIRGDGEIDFEGLALTEYRLGLDGAGVRVTWPDDFRGVYEGHLDLRGDGTTAALSGDLAMLRGVYDAPFELATLLGAGAREYDPVQELELPARVFLDVNLTADGNVFVRNDVAQIESDFDLHLGGDLERPEVTGRLRLLEGGELSFRDVRYRLESGTLDFVEIDRVNPYMNIRARTIVRQYEVFLRIEGTLDRFTYELSSNPTLTQQDIIALLTTGDTLEELTARGGNRNLFTGDLAAAYFTGALTQRFESQLKDLLGLERIEISPLLERATADPTARITLGKEVADRLFLIYSSDLGTTERQLYRIEWQASRKFRLTAERDTTGGIGSAVLYSDHFWWRRPEDGTPRDPRVAARARDRAGSGPRIASIDIAGPVSADDEAAIRKRLPLAAGDRYSRSTLFDGFTKIREHFVRNGRIQARVDAQARPREGDPDAPSDGAPVDVLYVVDPGPHVAVEITGTRDRARKKLLERLRALWNESVFTDDVLLDSAEEIREWYQERGYYAVDVTVREDPLEDGRRTVWFDVDPGSTVRVSGVEIRGNERVPRERIRSQMLTLKSSVFTKPLLVPDTLRDDVVAIRNLYRDQGFLDVEIEDPDIRLGIEGDTASIVLRIDEGEPVRVGRVAVEIDDPDSDLDPETLAWWSRLEPSSTFSPRAMRTAESKLRAALDKLGWPDARIDAYTDRRDAEIDVRFAVRPGGHRRVARISIEGNESTKTKIVRRELALSVGDPISREAILQTQHRLYRLGIFRNVEIVHEAIAGLPEEERLLRVRVEEAPPLGVTVGAGWDSEAGPQLSLSVSHDNVAGYDRSIAVQARRSDIERRTQLLLEDPRLFNYKWPALATVLREEREETGFTVRRRATAFRVEKRFSPKWTSFLRYNFQRVDLFDVTAEALDEIRDQKLENLVLGDVGYSILRDSRDDPFLTRDGTYLSVDARVFAEPALSEESFVKLFAQYNKTRTFSNGQTYSGSVRLGWSRPFGSTTSVPLSERFFAGGDSTLRGFERDGVDPGGGEALLLLNQEYRVPLWRALRGVVFYDAGNTYEIGTDLDPTDLRHVLGTGLRFETPIGPLRFEYGRKLDRRDGESSGEFFVAIGAAW